MIIRPAILSDLEAITEIYNEAVLNKLFYSSGFIHIGTMIQVGFKFGKYLDVHLVQLMLDSE